LSRALLLGLALAVTASAQEPAAVSSTVDLSPR
jgi:hypothetical protein